jgi:hypothetical protein
MDTTNNPNIKQALCSIRKIDDYRNQPYTRILNATLRDNRLGGLARAILAYALSLPPDWLVRSRHLEKEFGCGRKAIRAAMKQLVKTGYARLRVARSADGKCAAGSTWDIRESPGLPWQRVSKSAKKAENCEAPSVPSTKGDSHPKGTYTKEPSCTNKCTSTKEKEWVANAENPHAAAIANQAYALATNSFFCPKYPYPDSENEMYETLERLGIEPVPDYDGDFFNQMQARDWTDQEGKPIYDWTAFYQGRLQITFPGGYY